MKSTKDEDKKRKAALDKAGDILSGYLDDDRLNGLIDREDYVVLNSIVEHLLMAIQLHNNGWEIGYDGHYFHSHGQEDGYLDVIWRIKMTHKNGYHTHEDISDAKT